MQFKSQFELLPFKPFAPGGCHATPPIRCIHMRGHFASCGASFFCASHGSAQSAIHHFSIIGKGHDDPWRGHPFNAHNNINNINGDPNGDGKGIESHSLAVPAVLALQEAYVHKVIDTVNDLDNVLYEITNEDNGSPGNTAWQYHMINFIKEYESGKPKQHPAGMTHQWPDGKDTAEFNSPGEWFSPGEEGGFQTDPPTADGSRVILNDTNHSFFFTGLQKASLEGQRAWVWKNFTRGNPLSARKRHRQRLPATGTPYSIFFRPQ